ncbi:MAG: glycosyltransferase family 1 protein [Acidimicrobiaceae bacterium]|nr:glycosyltransferase family 1 protein [Acidimicrobiaceae bacterium]
MSRAAVLSLHTSPLVLPGRGDAGGMNVYVRELVSALAQTGIDATVFVRRNSDAPTVVDVEPGFRVVHVAAGSAELSKELLPGVVEDFADGVGAWLQEHPVDVLHANYWLSGVAGHRLKHELDLPLVSTFHTLARVKAETGDPEPQRRIDAEAEVIACSDVITANSVTELQQLAELYGADPKRIDVVAPGVDGAVFSVGSRRGARAALGLEDGPVLLFVGRIQPLKGLDVAVETLAGLRRRYGGAQLLVVGGASGPDGERELLRLDRAVRRHRLQGRVVLVPPQPHHLLSTYYRAADVCLVPSRSESFGLVALEAAACGVPVVAADVGGLRTLVDHGRNGFRISERDPARYTEAVLAILDDPSLASSMARRGAEMAGRYSWTATAARLRRIFADLSARVPLDCTV